MKKQIIMAAVLLLAGCASPQESQEAEAPDLTPEVSVVHLAESSNGHVFNMIAEKLGYLEDEGLRVEYVHVNNDTEVFEGLKAGTIDIASNSGTNLPLQYIAEGMDLTIFGGYMLTGCMPVFTRKETEWHGISDLIGSTMACEPNLYAVTGPLLDLGYDPLNQVNWYNPDDQTERINAVKSGEADYGLVGTSLNYAVNSDPDLKVLTYACDILPNYSCCRAEAMSSWLREHPNTVRALLKAWIRAMAYYESHHEETVKLVCSEINQDEEYVRAFLDNPRCDLKLDPMKSAVTRAWDYMDRLGLLDRTHHTEIEDHINIDLYKEALDACQKEYGSENPDFYEELQAAYALNNY